MNYPNRPNKIPALQPQVAEQNLANLMARITTDDFKVSVKKVLPPNITPDRFVATMIAGINSSEQRLKFAQCDFLTLFTACQKAANEGLLLDGEEAALVPFTNNDKGKYDIQYMRMTKGLVQLAESSDKVDKVEAHVVYQKDFEQGRFIYRPGIDVAPAFHPEWFADRGQPVGAFAAVYLKNGQVITRVLTKQKIMSIANRSRTNKASYQPNSPDFEEFWIKAALRAVLKYAPRKMKVHQAISDENIKEFPDMNNNIIDQTPTLTAPTVGGEMTFNGTTPKEIEDFSIPQGEPAIQQTPVIEQQSNPEPKIETGLPQFETAEFDIDSQRHVDSTGECFDPDIHCVRKDTGEPTVADGRFVPLSRNQLKARAEAKAVEEMKTEAKAPPPEDPNDPTQGKSVPFCKLYELIEVAETLQHMEQIHKSDKWSQLDRGAGEGLALRKLFDAKKESLVDQAAGSVSD